MLRTGHVGIGLLLYAPLAIPLSALDHTTALTVGLAGMLVASTLPDVDEWLPLVSHRGVTHSMLAAAVLGAVYAAAAVSLAAGGGLGATLAPLPELSADIAAAGGLGFAVGLLGVVGHLAGDALTPMGVAPWWPLSRRRHSLALVGARNWLANAGLLVLGALAVGAAVGLGRMVRAGAPLP